METDNSGEVVTRFEPTPNIEDIRKFQLEFPRMIKEEIIVVPVTDSQSESESSIPDWIKTNAGWWADGQIDDDTFIQGIQFLIKAGIIVVGDN